MYSDFLSFFPGIVKQFDEEGYVVLPEKLPAALLEKLRSLFDEQMAMPGNPHRVSNTVSGNTYTCNIDHLMHKGNLACLELLGWPLILQTAASICGNDFFLIQEFAVIKMLGDDTPVLWHQDMLHQRTGRCFTMGIYLDDADADDGALCIIPGSHRSKLPICELRKGKSANLPMKAGQILIHDMMLAHSSGPMQRNQMRRVLYFEFLSLKQVLTEQLYTEELLQNRFQLLQLAIEYYRQLHPEEPVFNWKNPYEENNAGHLTIEEVCSIEVHAKASAYCLEHLPGL